MSYINRIQGQVAEGDAASGAQPVLVAGKDGSGDVKVAVVDAAGAQIVAGEGVAGTPAGGVVSVQGVASGTAMPVSAASLPLPTGAATAAKQPALGTAGTPSADVISVQGVSGGVGIKVDGPVAVGAPASGENPLLMGGQDSSGDVQAAKVDANGSQYSVLTSPNGAAAGLSAYVTPFGQLNVSTEGSALFTDYFNSTTIDTTGNWNAASTAAGGAVSQAGSSLSIAPGTSASAIATIASQSTFTPFGLNQLTWGCGIRLEATTIVSGLHRFWGQGTPGSQTAAAPLTDAIGFEITTAGVLQAVIYAGGSIVYSQALTVPVDGAMHSYGFIQRADIVAFYFDSIEVPSAVAQFIYPNSSALPIRLAALNGLSSLGGTPTMVVIGVGVSDSGANNVSISDPTYRYRQQRVTATPAARNSMAAVTTAAPQALFRTTFADVRASSVDPTFFSTVATGSGQAVSQSAGSLVITTGTTTNAETILRSVSSFSGALITRAQNILSQRIVNNNFFVELVDVIGDGLTASASSATVLVVTIPNNPFTSANVGQGMYIGALAGGLVGVPNRYVIASVSGNNVTFTVAGFSVTSGTCSLFGWNYYQQQFQSTTATNVSYDAQRRGWNSGQTTATINTTASPGTMTIMSNEDGNAFLSDQLVASGTAVAVTQRASRVINLPEESTTLYLQIRALNGSTAPASTTTWTLGTVSVENYSPTQVSINTIKPQGLANTMPVSVTNTPAVTISSGTVTTVTTVTTCSTVTTLASMTSGNLGIPGIIADVASAAITTTTTTAAFTPTFGVAYKINVPVTVVSGTTPTYDLQVQESYDSGTNWVAVYDFPRITATGSYNSAPLYFNGNRVRYVQTISGTTPSFTRAINRLQMSGECPMYRQQIDRTIVPTTLNSTTPTLVSEGAKNMQLVISLGAATTPPSIQIQGSDDAGASWYSVGTPLAGVASSTVQATVPSMTSQMMRGIVTTAGTGVTLGYVLLRAF